MISKPLDSITLFIDDLQLLLENRISEGKTIEYKQVLPDGTSEEKIKFLRAVSSFANTAGGDLLYGVEAQDGIPVELTSLQQPNEDEIKPSARESAAGWCGAQNSDGSVPIRPRQR